MVYACEGTHCVDTIIFVLMGGSDCTTVAPQATKMNAATLVRWQSTRCEDTKLYKYT